MTVENRIEAYTTIEDMQRVRSIWDKYQTHPNADFDFYSVILNSHSETMKPCILALYSDHKLELMLIGRLEQRRLALNIGYWTICKPKVVLLNVIYGGVLGDQNTTNCTAAVSELMKYLKKEHIDAVFLSNLRIDTPLYQAARLKPETLSRDRGCAEEIHWQATLPSSIDDFYKGINSKHRYWLRRIGKILEKDFPGKVVIRHVNRTEDVDQLCNDVEEVAKHSFQRSLGGGFICDDEHKNRLKLSAKKGWLRASVLYIDNAPSAFWIATCYGNTAYLDFTGYIPRYKKYEVGTILLLDLIKNIIENTDARVLDFGFGDALYKQRFGDSSWRESPVYIFAPTMRGIKLNALRTAMSSINGFAQYILKKTNLIKKIRQWKRA